MVDQENPLHGQKRIIRERLNFVNSQIEFRSKSLFFELNTPVVTNYRIYKI